MIRFKCNKTYEWISLTLSNAFYRSKNLHIWKRTNAWLAQVTKGSTSFCAVANFQAFNSSTAAKGPLTRMFETKHNCEAIYSQSQNWLEISYHRLVWVTLGATGLSTALSKSSWRETNLLALEVKVVEIIPSDSNGTLSSINIINTEWKGLAFLRQKWFSIGKKRNILLSGTLPVSYGLF